MSDLVTTSPQDELALTHCPQCDYALAGLPPEGICPECGKPYDQRFIILTGDASGSRAMWHNASGRTMWKLTFIQILCVSLIVLPQFLGGGHRRMAMLYLLCIVLPVAMALAKRFGNPRRGSVQVILGPEGASQVDTLDQKSALAVIDRWAGTAVCLAVLAVMFSAGSLRPNRVTMIVMACIFAVVVVAAWLRRRGRVKANRADGQQVSLVPWSKIDDVEISPIATDRWHIHLAKAGTFLRSVKVHVDADVLIDPAPAVKLGLRIRQWRTAGSTGASQDATARATVS